MAFHGSSNLDQAHRKNTMCVLGGAGTLCDLHLKLLRVMMSSHTETQHTNHTCC